jgi:hypothetical protein
MSVEEQCVLEFLVHALGKDGDETERLHEYLTTTGQRT